MAADRGTIDQQLEALGEGARWWNQLELRDLPAVMRSDERILAITRGKIARGRWLRRSWLIVVTEQRLLVLHSRSGAGWNQLEVPISQIVRVAFRVGPFRGRVLVVTPVGKYRLLVPRTDGYKVVQALMSQVTPGQAVTGFAPTRMVRQVIDHVLALPAVALNPHGARQAALLPAAETSAIERRLQRLEEHVQQLQQQVEYLEQLQQQVDFLEQLLQRSAAERQLAD
jgi:hypothetical protein